MLDLIRKTLQTFEEKNSGCDYSAEYELSDLGDAPTLAVALDFYFAAQYTSISPARPASDWHIQVSPVESPVDTLRMALNKWLVDDLPTDAAPWEDRATSCKYVLDEICGHFDLSGTCRVIVRPPLWYSCVWEDFALVRGDTYFLLHLGFSD